MAEKRKGYSTALQQEAVRLMTDQRYGVAATARTVGIHVKMLRRGNPEYPANVHTAVPGHGRLPSAPQKLPQLRAEGKRLRLERDMGKNARRFWVNARR